MSEDQKQEEEVKGIKKTTTKHVREFDVVVSDRCKLVQSANDLVYHMVQKQVLPTIGSGNLFEKELDTQERATYDAALRFLERQFESGYTTTEPHERRVESEKTYEF